MLPWEERDKDLIFLPFYQPYFRVISCALMWPVTCFFFWGGGITMGSWIFMYVISTHCNYPFDAQIFTSLVSGSPFKLAALSFWNTTCVFFVVILAFWCSMFQAFLELSLYYGWNEEPIPPWGPVSLYWKTIGTTYGHARVVIGANTFFSIDLSK